MKRAISFPVCHLEVRLFVEIKESLLPCDSGFVEHSLYHLKRWWRSPEIKRANSEQDRLVKGMESDDSFCAFLETLVCLDWQAGAMSPERKCLNSCGAYLLAGSPPGWSWLSQKQSPVCALLVACPIRPSPFLSKSPLPSRVFPFKRGGEWQPGSVRVVRSRSVGVNLASPVTEIFIKCHVERLVF